MFEVKFLGTSDSGGIPTFNCKCSVCEEHREQNKKNLATCAYIQSDDGIILLDVGIDEVASIFDRKKIKAIFVTHFHADHVLGLLRLRYGNDKIDCYHPKDDKGFADLFKHKKAINYIENEPFKEIHIGDITLIPIPLKHSKNTTGYIIKDKDTTVAYLSDCAGIDKKTMEFLQRFKFDKCFIDACLAPDYDNGNHLNYEQASEILDELNSHESYLIHASHFTLEYIKQNNITLKYRYF